MSTTTQAGRNLRQELNDALIMRHPDGYIPLSMEADISLLMRRVRTYANRQEQACSYEWACGDKWDAKDARLEESIKQLALTIPFCVGVTFQGDPRGYVVKLQFDPAIHNGWGKDGWGIA